MLKDRLGIALHLARHVGRATRHRLAAPLRIPGRWRTRLRGERLLIAPQTIRTVDPTVAAEIAAGHFTFGGRTVEAIGRSPFASDPAGPPGDAWTRQLAGFGWLRHLRVTDDPALRERGRGLVGDFLAVHGRAGPAWESAVVARRLLSFLSQSPLILGGAERDFYLRFVRALDAHAAELEARLGSGLDGRDRLLAALALAEYGLCVEMSPARQRRGANGFAAAIAAQLLPDGGHVSRDPQLLIDLLLDLLPLRQAYAARGLPPPPPLVDAINGMIAMLRLLRHGDGTIALFNGMGRTASDLVATILAYDDSRAAAPLSAPSSGYQRLEGGSTVAIVDSGKPPPRAFSMRAHAGTLSFELSSGATRIVVNCGGGEGGRPDAARAARLTAAHSTLAVADASTCRFAAAAGFERYLGGAILAGPTTVVVERGQAGDATVLALAHDGYARRFGLVHRRSLALSGDGSRLDGHDALEAAAGGGLDGALDGRFGGGTLPVVLRFHLHPLVKARGQDASGDAAGASVIRLDLPGGESWMFEVDRPGAVVEPSILFAAAGGPRPTSQIVVTGEAGGFAARWSFRLLVPALRPTPR